MDEAGHDIGGSGRDRVPAGSRRLTLFAAGVFSAESAFFAVVPPLVPRLVHEVHLTTTEVGILVAAYPAGVLLAAVPSIALVDRRGVRRTTIAGLAVLVAATLGFGWGTAPLLLDAARLAQGVGGAVAWAGALAWLTSTTPTGRRASAIGGAVGSALVGMVLGPAMGAVASVVGRGPVFSALALVLTALALAGPPDAPASAGTRHSVRALLRLLRSRQAAIGSGGLLVIGIVGGTAGSLVPLLVAHRHGGPEAIAAIFAASYLLGAVLAVLLGRLSDRFGAVVPTLLALAVAGALLPPLPAVGPLVPLAAVAAVAGAVVSSLWTPTAAMVTDGAEPGPGGHAVGVALMNAAWAAGGAGGAVAVARLADTAGFGPPFALVGGLCAAGALALLTLARPRWPKGFRGAREGEADPASAGDRPHRRPGAGRRAP